MAVLGIAVSLAAFVALAFDRSTPEEGSRDRTVVLELAADGTPAVPEPAADDRGWTPSGFAPLQPSRTDGRPTFSNAWFSWQDSWLSALRPRAGEPGLRYLEVGVFEGQALVWMFENVLTDPTSAAVAIDLFAHEGLEERFRENLRRAGIEGRVQVEVGLSNERLRALGGEPFDVVYIDASHLAADVMRDAVLAWDLLAPGGVMIFDDYGYTPTFPDELRPGPAIDAFITAFRDELEIVHRGWQVIVRREADPCPGNASVLGPYCYHWNSDPRGGVGTLVDPRTDARVPLSEDEAQLVEDLLRARPSGRDAITVERSVAEGDAVKQLREKLHL